MKYTDKAFINSDYFYGYTKLAYTMAHELMHLLAHEEFGQDDHNQYWTNILFDGGGMESVLAKKRINQTQEGKIHTHPEVRNLNP